MSFQPNRPLDNPSSSSARGRRRPVLFVLLVLALIFAVTYASRLSEYWRLLSVEASMQAQIDDVEARGRQLAADLAYVKSPEYTEKVAITEMGLKREGDQVLTIIDAQTPAEDRAERAPGEAEVILSDGAARSAEPSVWRQWLSIFRAQGE